MRVIRFILVFIALFIVLAAIAALIVFSPFVQTWYVNRALNRNPDWHASVESASVGFSAVSLTNVRVERGGAVLTIPQLDAALPVRAALWQHRISITRLIAKGCSLDLTPRRGAQGGAAVAAKGPDDRRAVIDAATIGTDATDGKRAPAQPNEATSGSASALAALHRWIVEAKLPPNSSVDGIELEGDVRIPLLPDRGPIEIHVKANGGGLTEGHTAKFAAEAATAIATENADVYQIAARGDLAVSIVERAVDRLQFVGGASSDDAAFPHDIAVTASAFTGRGPHDGECMLEIGRGGRRLLSIAGSAAASTRRVDGTWKLDVGDGDLARVFPAVRLLPFTIGAEGEFSVDRASPSVRLIGRATGRVRQLGGLIGAGPALGDVTATVEFDATQRATALQVDRFELSLAEADPIATVRAVQPFSVNVAKREIATARGGDWLQGSILKLPLAWLPPLPAAVAFARGTAAGGFTVATTEGGYVLRSTGPLVARDITIEKTGRALARDLDVTAEVTGRYTSNKGWVFETSALELTSAGRRLGTFSGSITPLHERYRSVSVAGTLVADLDACSSQPIVAEHGWIRGRSLTAEFKTNIGVAGDLIAKLNVTGHARDHSIAANFSGSIDDYSLVTFRMPTTITAGSNVAEVSANGTWTNTPDARQVDITIDSSKITLEHLELVGAALGFRTGDLTTKRSIHEPAPDTKPIARDSRPFWGDLAGRVRIDFRDLAFGRYALENVGATFDIEHDAFRLRGGRGIFNPSQPTKLRHGEMIDTPSEPRSIGSAEAEISFDPKADLPYAVKASGTIDEIDSARLLGATRIAGTPLLEGHFSVGATLAGSGASPADVIDRSRVELRLTSKAGILRLLKTDVASAIPDAPHEVSDALATVGSAFGAIFGRHGNSIASENHLPKTTEAVLNATYETKEFSYTELALTATRGPDGSIALTDVIATAPRESLTGSGTISSVDGQPLNARPIHLDLQLAVKGTLAERLKEAGLVGNDQDALGYTKLWQPLSFGGTLADFDNSAWNALLVKAATSPAKPTKRGG